MTTVSRVSPSLRSMRTGRSEEAQPGAVTKTVTVESDSDTAGKDDGSMEGKSSAHLRRAPSDPLSSSRGSSDGTVATASSPRRAFSLRRSLSWKSGELKARDKGPEDVQFLESLVQNSFGEATSTIPADDTLASSSVSTRHVPRHSEDIFVINRSQNPILEEEEETVETQGVMGSKEGDGARSGAATPTLKTAGGHASDITPGSTGNSTQRPASTRLSRQIPKPLDLNFDRNKMGPKAKFRESTITPSPVVVVENHPPPDAIGLGIVFENLATQQGTHKPFNVVVSQVEDRPPRGTSFLPNMLSPLADDNSPTVDDGQSEYYSALPTPTTPWSTLSTSSGGTSSTISPMLVTPPSSSLFGTLSPPPSTIASTAPSSSSLFTPVFSTPALKSPETPALRGTSSLPLAKSKIREEPELDNATPLLKLFRPKSKTLNKSVASFSSQKRLGTGHSNRSDAAFEMQEFGVLSRK